MSAWQFHGTGKELVLTDVPEPVAGAGEVLVETRAAGLGYSDVSTLHDAEWAATLARR
jgi:propanol-preferring alcohol dehydrogenase